MNETELNKRETLEDAIEHWGFDAVLLGLAQLNMERMRRLANCNADPGELTPEARDAIIALRLAMS